MAETFALHTVETLEGDEYIHRGDLEGWLKNRARLLADTEDAVGRIASATILSLLEELTKSVEVLDSAEARDGG